jgi:hypothetical protein
MSCCGFYTLENIGEYDIFPVYFWEDDPIQKEGHNYLTILHFVHAKKKCYNIIGNQGKMKSMALIINAR